MSDPTTTNRPTTLRVPSPESFDDLSKNMRDAWLRLSDAARAFADAIEQSNSKTHTN